jgi:hypothetical protein
MMAAEPYTFNIDRGDRSLYQKVVDENVLQFKERDRKDQFIFAMAIGFANSIKHPLAVKESFFRTEYLRPEDAALIRAIALHEHGIEILADNEKVFQVAEEYAHAGIKLLVDELEGPGFANFSKRLEKELYETYEKLSSMR